jgi:rod shape-determining protein MreD
VKARLRVWLVVVGLVVLHFFLHAGLGVGRAAPDLLTVGLLLASREVGVGTAAGLGLGLGLLEDALSVLSFGANAVALSLVGLLGAVTRDLFVGDSLIFLVSYFVLGKWMRDLLTWMMLGHALRHSFVEQVIAHGFLDGLYAAAVGIVVLAAAGLWREPVR